MRLLQVMRYFRAADPMPPWLLVLTAAVGLYVAVLVIANPAGVDESLALLLLWQMFCASSGFMRHAAAGHFDVALVRWPRAAVSVGHAVHSVWLVILIWLLVAALEAGGSHRFPVALDPGRLAALAFVSCMSWALALPAARLVTGSLWLGLIVAAVTTRFGAEQYTAMLARPDDVWRVIHAAALTVVCPFLLIGDHVPGRAALAAVLLAASSLALVGGIAFIARRDYPLEPAL